MTLGTAASDVEQRIDFETMRSYKLERIREQMVLHDLGALICFDPDNIRYITSTNLAEWSRDKFVRWCVLPRDSEPVLFELGTAGDVKRSLCPWLKPENIRPSRPWLRGGNQRDIVDFMTALTAADIGSVLKNNGVEKLRTGVDVVDLYILNALQHEGLNVVNGWDALWDARMIKSPEELKIIEISAALVDACYEHIVDAIRPGVKESEIVGMIYGWLISQGCDRITGVNCVSGPRSNPHPHDFSDRMIRPGDLVFIDIISHYLGYATCYYRTFAATFSTPRQENLYKKAYSWLQSSIEAIKPGATTADIASQWPSAIELGFEDEIQAAGLEIGHGLGLSNHEKPFITRAVSIDHPEPLVPGMHMALETFAGEGQDGARIESQVIITESGYEVITKWPCEKLMVCNPR